jgi:SpoVK/Ycf46/Vps4 family AAA+-type ATPase
MSLQLGALELQSDYRFSDDPIASCFDEVGRAILAADDEVNPRELERFSQMTELVNAKGTELDARIKELMDAAEARKSESQSNSAPTSLATCISQLHALVGLGSVKTEVETLINLAKVFALRKQRGLPVPDVSFHMVFSGNPGTGKTTVARIVGNVYGCLGLLERGHVVEVDRSGLVRNFVGQTATKTKKVIESARGGVLFVDEAYALAKGGENDFGAEAIETLLKAMEDLRDEIVIIVAGYEDRMGAFLASNPGLRSRFPRVLSFPDYSAEDLYEILSTDVAEPLKETMLQLANAKALDFANAREVRNLFERVIAEQANRVANLPTIDDEVLTTITSGDLAQAIT